MGDAVSLFFALPTWYFGATFLPSAWDGLLLMMPRSGVIGLIVGVVWGATKREGRLLVFLLLPAASQVLVGVAGLMRGWFQEPSLYATGISVIGIFLALQIAGAGYLVFRSKGARWPAAAIAVFTTSYAVFASIVASMAFRNTWI